MSTPSDAVTEARVETQVASRPVAPTSTLLWSVRRELWENRSIVIAPIAVAVVFLAGFAITAGRLPGRIRAAAALDPLKQRAAVAAPYDMAAGLMMATALVVAVIY